MQFNEPFGGLIPGAQGSVMSALLRTDAPLTGRQVYSLLSHTHSLWSVQQALKTLDQLGLVTSVTVGRAQVHTINKKHTAITPLRALVDPIARLTATIKRAVDHDVEAVLLFGSIARGEATTNSDIDLAVIANPGWGGQVALGDAVRQQLGNSCNVLVFTSDEFSERARAGEPVVADILREGFALLGTKPQTSI